MDFEEWKHSVREPAQKNSEGLRRVEEGLVGMEYEIGRLPDGRFAIRYALNAPQTGVSTPWRAYETREQCIDELLEKARFFFESHETLSDTQNLYRRKMMERLQGGLFGFEEPEAVLGEAGAAEMTDLG